MKQAFLRCGIWVVLALVPCVTAVATTSADETTPLPKLGELMDEAEDDVLAFMALPKEHWAQLASTNPLERLNKEIKRRANVVGIFPNDDAIIRLVGTLMAEQNDEWQITRRYMSLETLARINAAGDSLRLKEQIEEKTAA